MGQAKLRKLAGTYPEQTPKPRTRTRIRRYDSPAEMFGINPITFPLMAILRGISVRKPGFKQMLREDEYDG